MSYTNTNDFMKDFNKGIVGFPYKRLRYTTFDIKKMFQCLKNEETQTRIVHNYYTIHNLDMNKNQLLFLGMPLLLTTKPDDYERHDLLSDIFNEENRIKCKFFSSVSDPLTYFNKNTRKLADLTLQKYKVINMNNLDNIIYENIKGCSSFKPINLKFVIDKFKCKSVLDPCSGWGDRLIAAMACNVRYVGVDPNYELHPKYKEMIEFFIPAVKRSKYTMIESKIQDAILPNEKFDLVFTSPPYFKIEQYSNNGRVNNNNENEWFDSFMIPMIKKTYDKLKYGGHMVLVINQLKNDTYINQMLSYIYNEITDLFYLGVISYSNKEIRNPQPMWIWKKSKKVPTELYNPSMIIRDHITKSKINYKVFRDDFLVGGTKQRALIPMIEKTNKEKYVYAGPSQGYAQIALAYTCKIMHKTAVLFLPREQRRTALTEYALSFGSVELNEFPVDLKTLQQKAQDYSNNNANSYLLAFGGHEPLYIKELCKAIKMSIKELTIKPTRIWIVAGSATILSALYKVFPKTHFCVVQVGKKIWPDQLEENRTTLYISEERFTEKALIQPDYPTVSTYDAKLFTFFLKYGLDGDYIWNVGKDL
jgi:DNA modification methylase